MAESIRGEVLQILKNADPQIKRAFVRSCVDKIKIAGNSVTINFAIKEPPASRPLMVAGVVYNYWSTLENSMPRLSARYV